MEDQCLNLSEWFEEAKRSFPWRVKRNPYRVLISEVMLQQTLAAVVVSYFNTWMNSFPDFESLANASEDEVIKSWEGLGYYSRARNLHQIAKRVINEFDGEFPSEIDQILSFKGIGPYTAAALSHFAFNKRVLGCDGNIKKVLARYYGYEDFITNDKAFRELLDKFLPNDDSSNCFEGLIELGATVCLKKPRCHRCPLQEKCIAYQEELTDLIPKRKKREKTLHLYRAVFVIEFDGKVLVKKESQALMRGLYEFPYIDFEKGQRQDFWVKKMQEHLKVSLQIEHPLEETHHTFTKYKAFLKPIKCRIRTMISLTQGYELISFDKLKEYPFSSGHRKILASLRLKSLAR